MWNEMAEVMLECFFSLMIESELDDDDIVSVISGELLDQRKARSDLSSQDLT